MDTGLTAVEIEPVYGGWFGVGGEGIEGLPVFAFPVEPVDRTESGQGQFPERDALGGVSPDQAVGVMHVGHHELVSNQADLPHGVEGLGENGLPAGGGRLAEIDLDNSSARGLEVGPDPEPRFLVSDEVVAGIEVFEEFHEGSVRPGQVPVEEGILVGRAPVDIEQKILPVLGGPGTESPLRVIGPLVDESVFLLAGPEEMVVDLLVEVGGLELLSLLWFVVAGVVESAVVLRPGCSGELRPLEVIGEVAARLDVPDLPLLPVRSGAGDGVSQQLAVV